MKAIKYFLMPALLIVIAVAAIANIPVNLNGKYYCTGYDPYSNSNYTGHIFLKKIGKSYSVVWNLSDSDVYTGAGMLNKDSTTLSVLFYKDTNVKNAGLAVYQIESSKHIRGEWVMSQVPEKTGFEDCIKQ